MYSKDQLDAILKFAENTIKMLYVFLSLFASQLLLASPFMIRKEQTENGVNTVSSQISKAAQQSTDPKAHPFPLWKDQKQLLVKPPHWDTIKQNVRETTLFS